MIGVNQRETKNRKETMIAVIPVRPPLLIPVADSAAAVVILQCIFTGFAGPRKSSRDLISFWSMQEGRLEGDTCYSWQQRG